MSQFVTIKKFCELTGMTPAAVYTRKCKGKWPEGTIWRYEPGSKAIRIDIEAYNQWVERGQESASSQTPAMKSPSLTKARAVASGSRQSPRLPTLES